MFSDDLIGDEEFVDSLAKQAYADDRTDGRRFSHTYIDATKNDVLVAIRKEIQARSPFTCSIFGVTNDFSDFCSYLSSSDDGTILWFHQKFLLMAAGLSKTLNRAVSWISVFEDLTCRAYLRFEMGKCKKEILDPGYYWKENLLFGEDLIGKGIRDFATLNEFLETLKSIYVPKEANYDFERIGQLIENNLDIDASVKPVEMICVENGELVLKTIYGAGTQLI